MEQYVKFTVFMKQWEKSTRITFISQRVCDFVHSLSIELNALIKNMDLFRNKKSDTH